MLQHNHPHHYWVIEHLSQINFSANLVHSAITVHTLRIFARLSVLFSARALSTIHPPNVGRRPVLVSYFVNGFRNERWAARDHYHALTGGGLIPLRAHSAISEDSILKDRAPSSRKEGQKIGNDRDFSEIYNQLRS